MDLRPVEAWTTCPRCHIDGHHHFSGRSFVLGDKPEPHASVPGAIVRLHPSDGLPDLTDAQVFMARPKVPTQKRECRGCGYRWDESL